MGSIGNPKTWIPYINTKNCSQRVRSIYCPQWCYKIFPPPPPIEFPEDNSNPTFSPLVIAIIGILVSAFLLVTYYIIISKYCRNRDTTARRQNNGLNVELEDNHNLSLHEPWHVATAGLDEALIKSIAVCKYKKGDGLVEGTDCPVCLSEFEEDEDLKLLPKCSHAFHVQCIDTWLKSHSNCPLCRANIASFHAPQQEQSPSPVTETAPDENVGTAQNLERVGGEIELEMVRNDVVPKTPFRAFSDLGNLEDRGTVIDIRDEEHQHIRRSFSMNFSCQRRVSGADEDVQGEEEGEFPGDAGAGPSRKWAAGDDQVRKCRDRKGVLNSVMSPVAMKRSFSSGRFLFIGHGRVRNAFIPV